MLKDIVKQYLIDSKGKDAALFEKADLRVAELGLDSLDMVEMLFEIEDICGFQLTDPMRYLEMGYAEMLEAIESEIREHNHGELPDFNTKASA